MEELNIHKTILKPTIDAIYGILRMENCIVSGINGVPNINKLRVNPEHIDLEFDAKYDSMYPITFTENLPSIKLETGSATYEIPQGFAHFEGEIEMGEDKFQHIDLRFGRLTQSTVLQDQSYYWRFIYPIENYEWFLKITANPYVDDYGTFHAMNLMAVDLDGYKMNVFSINVNNDYWMILESTESIVYEEMNHRVMSIITALGFVVGKRFGDFRFNVASNDAHFYHIVGTTALTLQKTKVCPYRILHDNIYVVERWLERYNYQCYALDEIKKHQNDGIISYHNDDAILTTDAFNKLSKVCYRTNDMMIAIGMLIDGSLMNIEYQTPFFHVALEVITSSLKDVGAQKLSSIIPQKQYKKEVVPVLKAALKGIPNLTQEILKKFSSRIDSNLNTCTNKDKLEALFIKYGYTLSEADKTAIEKRNTSFHGHIISNDTAMRHQYNELLAVSLRLHKLCSILILKEAGFSGKVINNEVLFGIKNACERKEPVFLDV